ncbi:molecular chaperone TorD family protein [Vibrio sp. 99-70-13A1]|uniref:TorD/DmsD family molecular chaperone n=1 Tax=Vibrio sp. 99-70-13A1 TaxID=2607601 RepID=UPI001493A190|nr:molecular chaperone TorD family protein [Vibrio sp. 99-70-13A1]NOH96328.1 molecular chaperone [Vibrio sp. 99-70-13A1]
MKPDNQLSANESSENASNNDESLRADIYLLIAQLFRSAPSEEFLLWLTQLEVTEDQHPMAIAWNALREAARSHSLNQVAEEYQDLFIGVGRGEVVQFGSWHITGSLMEKPLSDLRQDLDALGFERHNDVKEPEDHISALLEVMSMLVELPKPVQQAFFNKHIGNWVGSFVEQLQKAKSVSFYSAVANLLNAYLTIEQVSFAVNPKHNKAVHKVDVKNQIFVEEKR